MDDRREQVGGRFVLLRHELPLKAERGSHWDLMLENRGVLLTWELPKLPPSPLPASFERLGIRRLPNHRIEYLEYEGLVSNDRGTVERVDFGVFQIYSSPLKDEFSVRAIGEAYQIELLVPKVIFSQVDKPRLLAGEVLQFIDLAKSRR